LEPLNTRLAERRFLLRESISLLDMALLPFVRQFAACDSAWFQSTALTHLQGWLKHLTATPMFESVMHKPSPWQPVDEAGHPS